MRIDTYYEERIEERGSVIMLELLLCWELGHDPILSGNTFSNVYSQVPTQPSSILLIMKNE